MGVLILNIRLMYICCVSLVLGLYCGYSNDADQTLKFIFLRYEFSFIPYDYNSYRKPYLIRSLAKQGCSLRPQYIFI